MATAETRAAVEAFALAVTRGNEPAMRAFLSDDYYGHLRRPDEPAQADRWVSLAADVRAALPDLAIQVDAAEREDGTVGVRAIVSGTHTGTLWGAPPTGQTQRWVFDLTLRRGDAGWVVSGDAPPTTVLATLRDLGVVPPADQMHLPPKHPIAPPEFLLKLAFMGEAGDRACAHLADARVLEPVTNECAQCVAAGGIWPALRMCLVCGFVGCCDTSTSKHMRQHHQETGHPVFRSIRMREGWIWCYEDSAFFERATLDRLAVRAGG